MASAGQFEAGGGVFVHEVLFGGREQGSGVREDGKVFDVSVASRPIAGQEDDVVALVVAQRGDFLIRQDGGQEVHAVDPLFDRIIPAVEAQVPGKHLSGEAVGSGRSGFGIPIPRFKHKVAEAFCFPDDDPVLARIKEIFGGIGKVAGRHLPQPGFPDPGGEAQEHAGIPVAALDFRDFRRHDQAMFPGDAGSRERAPATVNNIADKRSLAAAVGDLVGKPGQDAAGDRFVRRRPVVDVERFGMGDVQKLIEQLFDLPGGIGMDGQCPAVVGAEPGLLRPEKRAHEHEEIR